MEYLATARLDMEKQLLQFDLFEVDTGVYFARPVDSPGYPEFYFAKVGDFWQKDGPYTYAFVLETVVEALGFRFDNKYPVARDREAQNRVKASGGK